jgi:hypothetical protein
MRMVVVMAVIVRAAVHIGRHEHDVTVAHAALGDDVIGKRLHLGTTSPKYRHFQTAVMADVDMERGLGEMVVFVEILREAFRET